MRWAQAIVALLAAGSLIPQLWSKGVPAKLSPLAVALGCAAALCAFQLIPLPSAVLELLSPTASVFREDGAALMNVDPWRGLTMDAPATLQAFAAFLSLLALSLVALRIAATEQGRYRLLASVGITAGVTAVIVGVHELLGATELYGFYDPVATPNVLGPLLNENHLGGFMAVGAMVALGLVAHPRQRSWMRAAWLVVVCACSVIAMLTQSRGATLALIIGALVTVGIIVGQRFTNKSGLKRGRARFVTSSLPISVVAACAVVVVVYSSAGGLQRQFEKTSLHEVYAPRSKFAAWRSAATLVEETPWVGIGRGAMESSFTRVHPASGVVTFSHLENEYIQTFVDWGIAGGLMIGAALLWLAAIAIRRWRDGPLAAGALGAIAAIAVQSNVDFGVELLGIAVPVTILVASLTHMPITEPSRRGLQWSRARRLILIGALGGCALLLFSSWTTSLDEDRRAIASGSRRSLDELRSSVQRHPLDYYGYAQAAEILRKNNDVRAVRLLNHAMALHPYHPGLHRLAAQMLYQTGRKEQSAIEFAAALRGASDPLRQITEIVSLFTTEQAAAAIPPAGIELDTVVRILKELNHPDVARVWLAGVLDLHPKSIRACELLYELFMQHGDLRAAEAAGRRCHQMMPDQQTRFALAQLLLTKGGHAEAIELLHDVESWHGRIDFNVNAWLLLCDAHAGRRDWDQAKRCLRRLSASGDVTLVRRGEITSRLEDIEKRRIEADTSTMVKPEPGSGSASQESKF